MTKTLHVLTPEYPPQVGGVGDYTRQLAQALRDIGRQVAVWCPKAEIVEIEPPRTIGHFGLSGLRALEAGIGHGRKHDILIQWVPHGYGLRAMNVPFCLWAWWRARVRRNTVSVMFHEPFLPYRCGAVRQNIAALVQRLMAAVLLQAASRVWISIPAWEDRLRRLCLGRHVRFDWLPVPSNVPVVRENARVLELRRAWNATARSVVGHFSTHGPAVTAILDRVLPALCARQSMLIVLIGHGSREYAQRLTSTHPALAPFVVATGPLPADELSLHLQVCDLMLQPYPDGVSTRRGSAMAALSHSRAIVTTVGELSEDLWYSTTAVCTAPADDPDAFVAAAVRLINDSATRARIGRAARELYDGNFNLRHTVAAVNDA